MFGKEFLVSRSILHLLILLVKGMNGDITRNISTALLVKKLQLNAMVTSSAIKDTFLNRTMSIFTTTKVEGVNTILSTATLEEILRTNATVTYTGMNTSHNRKMTTHTPTMIGGVNTNLSTTTLEERLRMNATVTFTGMNTSFNQKMTTFAPTTTGGVNNNFSTFTFEERLRTNATVTSTVNNSIDQKMTTFTPSTVERVHKNLSAGTQEKRTRTNAIVTSTFMNTFINRKITMSPQPRISSFYRNASTNPKDSAAQLSTAALLPPTNTPRYLQNIFCSPQEDVVAVDPQYYRFMPYFVKLHRCQGANADPEVKTCKPKSVKTIKVSVLNENFMKYEEMTLTNHTECEFTCKRNGSSCTKYGTWDPLNCMCNCPQEYDGCGSNAYWEWASCACVCLRRLAVQCQEVRKSIDPKTCECVNSESGKRKCSDSLEIKYIIIIMIAELVIVAVICALFFYRYFQTPRNKETPEELRLRKSIENDVGQSESRDCLL